MTRKALTAVLATAVLLLGLTLVAPSQATAAGGLQITNYGSGRCVAPLSNSTDRNVPLVQSNVPCPATWEFTTVLTGIVVIRLDANTARCMVPSGSSTVVNAAVVSGTCGASAFFEWELVPVDSEGGRDWYQLRNTGSGLCMAVNGNSTAAGASILQARCHAGGLVSSGQRFTW